MTLALDHLSSLYFLIEKRTTVKEPYDKTHNSFFFFGYSMTTPSTFVPFTVYITFRVPDRMFSRVVTSKFVINVLPLVYLCKLD